MKRARGFSVIELMVAAALLSIVLTVLLAIFVPIMRSWVRSDKRAYIQTQPALVVARLREELRGAEPQSLVQIPNGLAFVSCFDANGQLDYGPKGDLLLQKRVAFYYRPDLKAVYCLIDSDVDSDPSTPGPVEKMPPAALISTSWLKVNRPDARRLAQSIQRFEVTVAPKKPVDVYVEAIKDENRSELRTSILPLIAPPAGSPAQTKDV